MNRILFLLLCFQPMALFPAHSWQERMEMVHSALEDARYYYVGLSHLDPETVVQETTSLSWHGFWAGRTDDGWTFEERRSAFNDYLESLSTQNLQVVSARYKHSVEAALTQCEVLCYTNAVPYLRGLVLNPNGIFRDRALRLSVKYGQVDDEATAFVEGVVTNVAFSAFDRFVAMNEYGKLLEKCSATNGLITHATWMFYRQRCADYRASIICDKVLASRLNGYAMSSNRLSYAIWAIDSESERAAFRHYFHTVTNQLLSSGRPLVQLTIGEREDE